MRILIVSADRSGPGGTPINLGDALLTDLLAKSLVEAGHVVEVADFGPSEGTRRYRVEAKGMQGLNSLVARNDAVILGGGTMIQQDSSNLFTGSLLRLCLATRLVSTLRRRPLAYFAVGCDPLESQLARWGYRVATKGTPVWVRDEGSARRFGRYFGRQPYLGADAALLAVHSAATLGLDPGLSRRDQLTMALNFRDAAHLKESDIVGLRAAAPPDRKLVFLAMSRGERLGDDVALAKRVFHTFDAVESSGDWMSGWARIAASSVVISSRMHALYISALTKTPMVAVGESAKIRGFAEEFGVPRIDEVSDYQPGMERVADEAAIDGAVERSLSSLAALETWLPCASG